MNCQLVKNENGTFLVFENEEEAEKAQEMFNMWYPLACFGGYYNALKIE